ncbi:hypothetical protein [Microbulbifer thermotolerans]|uniref:hypothetical protein n=1 Tax=Microbulbifer thermotolerans TaxID=252514 RepID=UPI00224B5D1D|nr:hypothetical protein [Microbulbifer thermotolerans]MCX2780398.1 hypothetical protein [Microbulbifer thermotolerans]MCX2805930.1 hypothetical protein [Microbulbifer thermotolerans]
MINGFSFSAAFVAVTRKISALLPRPTAIGGDELEAVKQRCRQSYECWGHCECPYPVGDIRRAVWVAETHRIVREQLSGVIRCGSVIEGECVNELIGEAANV